MIYLLFALLFLVVVVFIFSRFSTKRNENIEPEKEIRDDCCGAHEVCEKDSLLFKGEIEYYNDEELDVFRHKPESNYNDKEIAMFAEVFYTLREDEVAGWLRSLQARHIQLPGSLRDEALMIVSERRS
jgi:hypothetical protein